MRKVFVIAPAYDVHSTMISEHCPIQCKHTVKTEQNIHRLESTKCAKIGICTKIINAVYKESYWVPVVTDLS